MADTVALTEALDREPTSALIVGAGYIGVEMVEALSARGLQVTQVEALPEVLPTVDAELGELVRQRIKKAGQARRHRRHCHPLWTVHRRHQRPRPDLHAAARFSLGRRPARSAGLGTDDRPVTLGRSEARGTGLADRTMRPTSTPGLVGLLSSSRLLQRAAPRPRWPHSRRSPRPAPG